MDATLAGLVAKAPDVAQPVEEFMYAYQKWLTELEQAIFALPPASEKPAPAGEAKGDRE
jgi:hypothetical protein